MTTLDTSQELRLDLPDTTSSLLAQGWTIVTDEGFIGLIGPFFRMETERGPKFCFPTDARHHNLRGVLQGGALMTFADRALGMSARAATGATRTATVQLNMQFIDAVQIGELVEVHPTVLRTTRQLMFLDAPITVANRIVASASGIWKRLAEPI